MECPACRKECFVKGGRAAELPIVYVALQGAQLASRMAAQDVPTWSD